MAAGALKRRAWRNAMQTPRTISAKNVAFVSYRGKPDGWPEGVPFFPGNEGCPSPVLAQNLEPYDRVVIYVGVGDLSRKVLDLTHNIPTQKVVAISCECHSHDFYGDDLPFTLWRGSDHMCRETLKAMAWLWKDNKVLVPPDRHLREWFLATQI